MEGVQGTNLGQYEGIQKPKCHCFKLQWPLLDWSTRFITSIVAIFGLLISISCLTKEKDIWRAISQSHNLTMSLRRTVRATRAAPPSPAGHHQDHDVHDLQDLYHLDHDQKHSSGQFLTHLVQTEDRRRVQPRPLLWQLQDPPSRHHVQVRSVENILIMTIIIIISISVVNKSVVV